jgi:metal-sulfur cluster biosynthetic enzyme
MPPVDQALLVQVHRALDEVHDPCSVGRGVPAGLRDMGLVTRLELTPAEGGGTRLELALRMTAPACTFQLYFDQQVRARLAAIDGLDEVQLSWDERFDWSDDDMSPELKQRLRDKRRWLERAAGRGAGEPT